MSPRHDSVGFKLCGGYASHFNECEDILDNSTSQVTYAAGSSSTGSRLDGRRTRRCNLVSRQLERQGRGSEHALVGGTALGKEGRWGFHVIDNVDNDSRTEKWANPTSNTQTGEEMEKTREKRSINDDDGYDDKNRKSSRANDMSPTPISDDWTCDFAMSSNQLLSNFSCSERELHDINRI